MSKNKKQGFTLVEILIALAILVMIAVPIARSFIQSANTTKSSGEMIKATQLAQEQMENIKNLLDSKDLSDSLPTTGAGNLYTAPTGFTTDTFSSVSSGVNGSKTGKWSDKNDKYIIEYSVTSENNLEENKADNSNYANNSVDINKSSAYVLNGKTEPDSSGVKMEMEIDSPTVSTDFVVFKNNSHSGDIIATGTGSYDSTKDMVLYLDANGISQNTNVYIDNEFKELNNLKIAVLNNNTQYKLNFKLSSNTNCPIKNIMEYDITDSSAYNNSTVGSNASRQVKLYTISIKVSKLDDTTNPLANIQSKRLVRK